MVAQAEAGERVGDVIGQMGVSRQTASRWLARARRGEPMFDRTSRQRRFVRRTPRRTCGQGLPLAAAGPRSA